MPQMVKQYRSNSQTQSENIQRISLSKHVTITITHILISQCICFRQRYQGHNTSKLLGHSRHGGSSSKAAEHADPTRLTTCNIQLKVPTDPSSGLQCHTRQTDRQNRDHRLCEKITTLFQGQTTLETIQEQLVHQDTPRCVPQCSGN